jgi:hypothetical protein
MRSCTFRQGPRSFDFMTKSKLQNLQGQFGGHSNKGLNSDETKKGRTTHKTWGATWNLEKIPQCLFRAEEKPFWTAGIWVFRTDRDSQLARSPANKFEWSLTIRSISYMWLPLYPTGVGENKNKVTKLESRWRTGRISACSSSMFERNNFHFLPFCQQHQGESGQAGTNYRDPSLVGGPGSY